MANKYISFREAATTADAAKDTTAGRMQVVKSENALVYEGTSVIKGISSAQADYVDGKLKEAAAAKLAVTLAVSPVAGGYYTGGKVAVEVTATIKYDGTLTDVASAKISASGGAALTKQSTGVYKGTYSVPAAANGKISVSIPVAVTYQHAEYGALTKTTNVAFTAYAPLVFLSQTTAPSGADIAAATTKFCKGAAAGTYSVPTSAGKDLYLCYPSFMTLSSIKSGGFDVPFDAATDVSAFTADGVSVGYKVRKKTDTPTASTGTMTIVLAN